MSVSHGTLVTTFYLPTLQRQSSIEGKEGHHFLPTQVIGVGRGVCVSAVPLLFFK